MGSEAIERALLDHHGLRITPEMSQYILAKLKSSPKEIPIIAGDAKTGMPIHTVISSATLQSYLPAQP